MRYLPIIGLEVHAQLATKTKMFCACANVDDDAPSNTAICPVCTGQPGALPALNGHAVELGMKVGLALGCRIPEVSVFDRKNYFYPDLPKGYQISQFHLPQAVDGAIDIDVPQPIPGRERIHVGIERAHLEEDAAKNVHGDTTGVDFNRAGTPLVEIVSAPDLRSASEAKAYLQELRAILRTIGASHADMEKGHMRCDANVSLLPVDDENRPLISGLNPKVEIKNLNSFRAVERAITYEIQRQKELYEAEERPTASTRGWDENKGVTFEQRSKETFADYRYFPEPDLPPQDLATVKQRVSSTLPELPADKRVRLQSEYAFTPADAALFVATEGWADYVEKVMGELAEWVTGEIDATRQSKLAKLVGGWMTTKLAGLLTEKNLDLRETGITPENFAEFISIVEKGDVNSTNALKLLTIMLETGADPSHIMEEQNLGQNMSDDEIRTILQTLINENPGQVEQVKAGKVQVIKWFVGIVMKTTEGRANPAKTEEIVKELIGV